MLATILLTLLTAAQAQSAFIRVNQVGYVSGSSKRAYLMAAGSEAGATFLLKNSNGVTVYSAPVGSSLGAWGSFTNVYPVDFDSVTTAGTYTLSVTTPTAASSPQFKIDTAASLYSNPLANAPSPPTSPCATKFLP
jgi:hypothetical protein